jgi:hypothetical protein
MKDIAASEGSVSVCYVWLGLCLEDDGVQRRTVKVFTFTWLYNYDVYQDSKPCLAIHT